MGRLQTSPIPRALNNSVNFVVSVIEQKEDRKIGVHITAALI